MTTQDPPRTWLVTFNSQAGTKISAHEHEITEQGDVLFTTYLEDGTEVGSCSLSRGVWRSVELVADKPRYGVSTPGSVATRRPGTRRVCRAAARHKDQ